MSTLDNVRFIGLSTGIGVGVGHSIERYKVKSYYQSSYPLCANDFMLDVADVAICGLLGTIAANYIHMLFTTITLSDSLMLLSLVPLVICPINYEEDEKDEKDKND